MYIYKETYNTDIDALIINLLDQYVELQPAPLKRIKYIR